MHGICGDLVTRRYLFPENVKIRLMLFCAFIQRKRKLVCAASGRCGCYDTSNYKVNFQDLANRCKCQCYQLEVEG